MGRKGQTQIISRIQLPIWFMLGLKALICTFAVQGSALTKLKQEYGVDIPIIKYFFAMFRYIDGWGMEAFFFFVGIATVLYIVRLHPLQHSRLLSGWCGLAGICMVVGRSYEEIGTWDYIFNGRAQMGLALFVAIGYYLLYKNVIILGVYCLKKWNFSRTECRNSLECFLFQRHPFIGPAAVVAACGLPFVIVFWPGTLQWDAHAQLWAYFGEIDWNNGYPIFPTWLSGQCIELGRRISGSDSLGFFFYTFPQYVIQWCIFAYGIYLLTKLKTPIIWRWLSLLYLSLFPLWRIWGYTMAKDSYYYMFVLLMVLIMIDIHVSKSDQPMWWKWMLLCISPLMCCLMRPNGMLLVLLTVLGGFVFDGKRWKIYVVCLVVSILPTLALNKVGETYWGIGEVTISESLSIPLQQTARYLQYHYEELTQEEIDVLSTVFTVDINQISYAPEISDGVKALFRKDATSEEVQAYLKVWLGQLLKHPKTCIQAVLNHTYGYFYPNRAWMQEYYGTYYLGNSQHWTDGIIDVQFGMKYQEIRNFYQTVGDLVIQTPVIGMLYSCGLQNYILIGCCVFLGHYGKKRELAALMPSVATVLMCLLSPANAYLRYMMPVMVLLPFNLAWCYYAVCGMKEQEASDISRGTIEISRSR